MHNNNELLVSYWHKIKGEKEFPSEDDLDPTEILDLWPQCFLMQFRDIDHVMHYNYSYLGEDLIKAYHDGDISEEVPDVVHLEATHLAKQFMQVRKTRKPLIYDGKHHMVCGRTLVYAQSLLPLSYDGDNVHSIFGHLDYEVLRGDNKEKTG